MSQTKKGVYGVKIKNPLRLPVVARVISKDGRLRGGSRLGESGSVPDQEIIRTIGPGDEVLVLTKGACKLDIDFRIIRYDEVGNVVTLGEADGTHVNHRKASDWALPGGVGEKVAERDEAKFDESGGKVLPAKEEEVEIRSLGEMFKDHAREEAKV